MRFPRTAICAAFVTSRSTFRTSGMFAAVYLPCFRAGIDWRSFFMCSVFFREKQSFCKTIIKTLCFACRVPPLQKILDRFFFWVSVHFTKEIELPRGKKQENKTSRNKARGTHDWLCEMVIERRDYCRTLFHRFLAHELQARLYFKGKSSE